MKDRKTDAIQGGRTLTGNPLSRIVQAARYHYYVARKLLFIMHSHDDRLRLMRWQEYNAYIDAFGRGVCYDPKRDDHLLMAVFSSRLLRNTTCPLLICAKSRRNERGVIRVMPESISHEILHRTIARIESVRASSLLDKLTRRGEWDLVNDKPWNEPIVNPFLKALFNNY